MPPHAVDTNILLRGVETNHRQHQAVLNAIDRLSEQGALLYILPQNVREFWNVLTRPRENNGFGKTPLQADIDVKKIESTFIILEESLATYHEWRPLVVLHQVSGVRVHDANLAAAMNVHGVTHLLTFNDRDFARYTNITTIDPSTV